jgi:hypothetical protein
MIKRKGKVLTLEQTFRKKMEAIEKKDFSGRLRSNELNRLWSLLNKMKWKRDLSMQDLQDLKEIESIQNGILERIYPEKSFFLSAFPKSYSGTICWFHNVYDQPIRELDPQEKQLWHKHSTHGFQGYIRRDGSIQAYVLSGRYDKEDT